MDTCASCHAHFYSAVRYCPYCGVAVETTLLESTDESRQTQAAPAPVLAPTPVRRQRVRPAPSDVIGLPVLPAPAPTPPPPAPAPESASASVPVQGPGPQAPDIEELATGVGIASVAVVAPPVRWGWKVVGLLAALGAVLVYVKIAPGKIDPSCDEVFDAGLKAISAHDFAAARNQSIHANLACTGALLKKATTLQTTLANAEAVANSCERSARAIAYAFDEHKLVSARNAVDRLGSACAAAEPLQRQLTRLQHQSALALSEVRKSLYEKDEKAARTAIDKLASINAEYPELAAFRAQLYALAKARTSAVVPAVPMTQPAPAPAPRTVERIDNAPAGASADRRNVPDAMSQPDISANARATMAQGFLHDAERALSQKQFDTAKTFIESARRLDPGNPRTDFVSQLIKERERQVLQQDTSIR